MSMSCPVLLRASLPRHDISMASGGSSNYKRGQGRSAEGAEGNGVWGGVFPSPLDEVRGLGRGHNFSILDLKMAILGACWTLFFTVQLFGLNAKASSRG